MAQKLLKNAVEDFKKMSEDFKKLKAGIESDKADKEYQISMFRKGIRFTKRMADEIQGNVNYMNEQDPRFADRIVPE